MIIIDRFRCSYCFIDLFNENSENIYKLMKVGDSLLIDRLKKTLLEIDSKIIWNDKHIKYNSFKRNIIGKTHCLTIDVSFKSMSGALTVKIMEVRKRDMYKEIRDKEKELESQQRINFETGRIENSSRFVR